MMTLVKVNKLDMYNFYIYMAGKEIIKINKERRSSGIPSPRRRKFMLNELESKYEGMVDGVYEEEINIDELPLKVTEVNGYLVEDINYDYMNKEVN